MAKQTINTGTAANDGTGDTLRNAFVKTNQNFTEVYSLWGGNFDSLRFYGNSLCSGNSLADTYGTTPINIEPDGEGSVRITVPNNASANTTPITLLNHAVTGNVEISTSSYANTWTFTHDARLIFPDGTEQITAYDAANSGGANTGDVTFINDLIQGSGYILSISPGSGFTTDNQFFRFRGGDDPSHLHFDTSDASAFDLFVGDDNKYVKVAKEGHIAIRSYDANGVSATWSFDPNGTTHFPNISSYGATSYGVPDIVNRDGEKISLWDQYPLGYSYSIGIEPDAMWFGVDEGLSNKGFNWYTGNNKIMELTRSGILSANSVVIANTVSMVAGEADAGNNTGSVPIDLNKTINKLHPWGNAGSVTGDQYTLADGIEGQIMYLVPRNGYGSGDEYTTVKFAHCRYRDISSGNIIEANDIGWWLPFGGILGSSDAKIGSYNSLITLIFTDGHWNLPHSIFD